MGTVVHALGWFAGSLAFWYVAEAVQTKTDIIAEQHANEVDLKIYKSIRTLSGSLPEDVRQRKDVSELIGLMEHHECSSKELVTGIINLSQEMVELAVTAGAIIMSGGGLGILPVAVGGYLKYRGSTRCAEREVAAQERANEIDIFYEDGDRALTTNSSISNLQLAHAHDKVVEEVATLRAEAASIRLKAFQANERDSWLVARLLEIPVTGACVLFMSQWMSGELSSATCIWLMLSIWSLRGNINQIGTLFSSQVTDLKLASYRHAALDISETLGDRREKVVLDEPCGVTFDKVRLRRRGSNRDTLKETSFTIEPGMVVGIVGNNGQGKSSLLGLISGRLLPTSGQASVGAHDTRHKAVFTGNLTQDYTLLAGMSVRANIERYRPPNRGMSAEAVVDLLGIREILCKNKPEGLDTVIPGRNQKSTNFSIGQRQLIALAQAVAAESGMLLLDEPLSALGPSMVAHINTVLLNLEKRPTIFFVTHKYEQANTCDWILVVDEGEVVEQGRPEELLVKRGGKYKALYKQQKKYVGRGDRSRGARKSEPEIPKEKGQSDSQISFPA
jgi:ABC-type multidrug transport system fused ATPase/permease subunit